MKKKAEITPLPWHVSGSSVFSEKPSLVSVCGGDDMPTVWANAAYIVRACNNFPELIAKLDKIATWLERNSDKLRQSAERNSFQSLAEAELADAKNYSATAADIRKCLVAAEGK